DREGLDLHSRAKQLRERFREVDITLMLLGVSKHHFDRWNFVETESVRVIVDPPVDENSSEIVREERKNPAQKRPAFDLALRVSRAENDVGASFEKRDACRNRRWLVRKVAVHLDVSLEPLLRVVSPLETRANRTTTPVFFRASNQVNS